MRRVASLFFVILALAGILCAEPKRRRVSGPNVLLITIDTLRADHLSCYGYIRRTSPNIDRLAAEGVRFARAYCPIPLTGPSHITLMTSLYPQQHGATINGMGMSGRRPLTLAQILHRLGYRTAAFVSAWPLKKGITGLGKGFGVYNQKFTHHYGLVNAYRTASDVTSAAANWLRKRGDRQFFLWIHYFDPHQPYVLHSEFAHLPSTGLGAAKVSSEVNRDPESAKRVAAYDSEVAYTDRFVGEILHQLAEQGLRDRTLVVLTADHGESLGEHNYVGHGAQLFQPSVHIPLVLSYPKVITPGRTILEDVELVDVMPTILDYLGFPARMPIAGYSLKPLIEGKTSSLGDRTAYFLTYSEPILLPPRWLSWIWTWAKSKMSPSKLGFVSGTKKVILDPGQGRIELYELDESVKNERPLTHAEANLLKECREQLTGWFQATNRGLPPEGRLSEEDLEMLRSLGYISP